MFKKRIARTAAALLLLACAAFANGVSGHWSGTVNNGGHAIKIEMDLRQLGSHVFGTMNANHTAPVMGEVHGDKLTLKGKGGVESIRIELTLNGETMNGQGWSQKANQAYAAEKLTGFVGFNAH